MSQNHSFQRSKISNTFRTSFTTTDRNLKEFTQKFLQRYTIINVPFPVNLILLKKFKKLQHKIYRIKNFQNFLPSNWEVKNEITFMIVNFLLSSIYMNFAFRKTGDQQQSLALNQNLNFGSKTISYHKTDAFILKKSIFLIKI